jgi:hypothetical protein
MRLTFSEDLVGDDLAEYFRRSDCLVEHMGHHTIEVRPRQALFPEAAKLEVEGLLRVWCKLHPDASVTASVVGDAHML